MQRLGEPLAVTDARDIHALARQRDQSSVDKAEQILRRYTLLEINRDGDGTVHVSAGGAERVLIEQGWRMFLLRIFNSSGNAGAIAIASNGRSGMSGLFGSLSLTPGHLSLVPQTNIQSW